MEKIIESVVAILAEIPVDKFNEVMAAAFKVAFPGPLAIEKVKVKTLIGELPIDYPVATSIWECIGVDGYDKAWGWMKNERKTNHQDEGRRTVEGALKKALKGDTSKQGALKSLLGL